jgi:hypothetical protein
MSPTMQARRARVRQIRRTVTAAAAAVFIALFATIYIQMAAGKDPALGSSTTTAQVSATSTPSSSSSSSTDSSSSSSDNSSSGTMTTAQS